MTAPTDKTTVVVGASRGLGRGIAAALAEAGRPVIAVARSADALAELADQNANIRAEVADATNPAAPKRLIEEHRPRSLVLVAGAVPQILPLQEQTWETFSTNWNADVRIAFEWVRETLTRPLAPGSMVIVISSGAALRGSPLSGGYAGSKATQQFITAYAQEEANRAGLGITYTAILPVITPLGDVGRPAVLAYAKRSGKSEQEYLGPDPLLTPETAGASIVDLVQGDPAAVAPGYRLTGGGLQKLP
jgi:NAD(P)-dependent dehydrogenase (short-subunit alcohol dehydrogenase family)